MDRDAIIAGARRARLFFCALAAASLASGAAASGERDDPRGLWLRPDGGEQFTFYECGHDRLCAKVASAGNAPDGSAIGAVILRGAKRIGPHEWAGRLFNLEDGKTYDGFITLESETRLTLKGCLWGVLCGDETWTRLGGPPEAHAAAQTSPR